MAKKLAQRRSPHHTLSRRERQIMDVIYRRGSASVADVVAELAGRPAYSTVRAQLRTLEQKGHLRHAEQGARYVYIPSVAPHEARQSMLRYLTDTFFDGSAGQVLATLLGTDSVRLSEEELEKIERLIERARKQAPP